jgi:hypothetical protein
MASAIVPEVERMIGKRGGCWWESKKKKKTTDGMPDAKYMIALQLKDDDGSYM